MWHPLLWPWFRSTQGMPWGGCWADLARGPYPRVSPCPSRALRPDAGQSGAWGGGQPRVLPLEQGTLLPLEEFRFLWEE